MEDSKEPVATDRPNEGLEPEYEETGTVDGPRTIDFDTARTALSDAFGIDERRGDTITNLHTTETDEGRQLVATVEKSRSTMLNYRLDSAKRTGQRAGIGASVIAVLAVVVYVVLTTRKLFGNSGQEDDVERGEVEVDD